jgi:hypothetical protein
MVMAEQQWRTLAVVIQEIEITVEQTLAARLAAAVHDLPVPASVLERMRQAVITAVRRAFQNPTIRHANVTVSTLAKGRADDQTPRSWGFFLVDRGIEDEAQHHIDVFVYPDGS